MPMNFGTSCEPSEEGSRLQKKSRRTKERKPLAERMDAFDRLVQLCGVRDRSSKELTDRLTADGYQQNIVEDAIKRAVSCGLVDDKRFLDSFVRGKVNAGKGLYGLVKDLEKHGLDPSGLEGWPDSYGLDEQSQIQRACEYLRAHPPKAKDYYAAAYRKLISRGYSIAIAGKACRLWADSKEEQSELLE